MYIVYSLFFEKKNMSRVIWTATLAFYLFSERGKEKFLQNSMKEKIESEGKIFGNKTLMK